MNVGLLTWGQRFSFLAALAFWLPPDTPQKLGRSPCASNLLMFFGRQISLVPAQQIVWCWCMALARSGFSELWLPGMRDGLCRLVCGDGFTGSIPGCAPLPLRRLADRIGRHAFHPTAHPTGEAQVEG